MKRALPWLDASGRVLPWHPTTGLVAVGFRKNGDPIWPVIGGDPVGGDNALLQRLSREHEDLDRNLAAIHGAAQDENRDLTDAEKELVKRHTDRKAVLDAQIEPLLEAEEQRVKSNALRSRIAAANPASQPAPDGTPDSAASAQRVHVAEPPPWMTADPNRPNPALWSAQYVTRSGREYTPSGYRTFAEWARDALIEKYDQLAARAGGDAARDAAKERLHRAPPHTLTSDIAGLLPGQHMAQIMDVIDTSRPLVATGRQVPLEQGKLTYPKIGTRPTVGKQGTEKTEATPYTKLTVTMETMTAETFLGAGNLSWQAMNWSTPSALQLWFDLCAEDYARKTEAEAGADLTAPATATTEIPGAVGPHAFDVWWPTIINAVKAAYTATGSRVMPNTIWAAPDRFFELLGIMAANGTAPAFAGQGSLNLTTLRGNVAGLTLVGTPGLAAGTLIVGDAQALLIGETAGAPVEMRAVEPAIGGMEVGLIGAFAAKVFDATRFNKLIDTAA